MDSKIIFIFAIMIVAGAFLYVSFQPKPIDLIMTIADFKNTGNLLYNMTDTDVVTIGKNGETTSMQTAVYLGTEELLSEDLSCMIKTYYDGKLQGNQTYLFSQGTYKAYPETRVENSAYPNHSNRTLISGYGVGTPNNVKFTVKCIGLKSGRTGTGTVEAPTKIIDYPQAN